jgi:hypothetical protein
LKAYNIQLQNIIEYKKKVGKGESTLQWPKNVVKNTIFQNCVTFNFNQANSKRGFYIQNKVVQIPNNAIFKRN